MKWLKPLTHNFSMSLIKIMFRYIRLLWLVIIDVSYVFLEPCFHSPARMTDIFWDIFVIHICSPTFRHVFTSLSQDHHNRKILISHILFNKEIIICTANSFVIIFVSTRFNFFFFWLESSTLEDKSYLFEYETRKFERK